jgi:phospholipid-binding lipoprotein MlaA
MLRNRFLLLPESISNSRIPGMCKAYRARLLPSMTLPALLVLGCAGTVEGDIHDPAEPVNRTIFSGNQFLDRNLLRPVARTYRDYVPQRIRTSVGNFSSNLGEPLVLVNDLLQGNVTRGWNTTQRVAINTTIGVAGLFDVAEGWGLPGHRADLGQTLGVWGVGSGPAIQLPLLGPSSVRDTAGLVGGIFANPVGYIPGDAISTIQLVSRGTGIVEGRARVLDTTDALEQSTVDPYAALRSVQAQRREALIADGIRGKVAR